MLRYKEVEEGRLVPSCTATLREERVVALITLGVVKDVPICHFTLFNWLFDKTRRHIYNNLYYSYAYSLFCYDQQTAMLVTEKHCRLNNKNSSIGDVMELKDSYVVQGMTITHKRMTSWLFSALTWGGKSDYTGSESEVTGIDYMVKVTSLSSEWSK